MRGFTHRSTVDAVLAWIDAQHLSIATENIQATKAAGRVLAADVTSSVNVPGFPKAMMDGFAVQANSSMGSSPYNPQQFRIVGQSLPGEACHAVVSRDTCVRIMTGAPMPNGADAVIPVEYTEHDQSTATLLEQVSPGKHVAVVGEDIRADAIVLHAGRRLRPQDLGVLASIGVRDVRRQVPPTRASGHYR